MSGLLTAALIVKNEAAVLDACLTSIRDVVDEILVVDTGSTDDSRSIARHHGALVHEHRWAGDFAAARNDALERATCDWILYIDADERLEQGDRKTVETLLRDAPEVAFRVLLRPDSRSTPYREYRIWRNHPRIRFEGVIHEKVVPAILRVSRDEGRAIGRADLLLTHVGYEGDQTHKHRRNLPLLRRQLEIEPDNLFNLHHLFRVLDGLGEHEEAEHVLEQAVHVARGRNGDPLGSLVFADLVRIRHMRGEDVHGLLDEARARYPDNWLIVFLEGRRLVDRKEYEAALGRFDALLAVDVSALPDAGPSYDARIFGALAHDARGICLFRLRRFAEAAEAWEQATRAAPDDPSLPVKRDLARGQVVR